MKKTTIVFLLFSLLLNSAFAQKNEQKLIEEGIELHDKGQYQDAIKKYSEALKINPKSTIATYEMALSYLKLKKYKDASKYSSIVINSNDKSLSVGAYCVKSEALAEMGDVDKAIDWLKEGLAKNGDDYLLHFNLAINYYKKNDLENTLTHVKKSIDYNKNAGSPFLLYAYALKDSGLWVQSILATQMFLLLEPDSPRSKNAFQELLQTMLITSTTDTPVERSFVQQQLYRNKSQNLSSSGNIPPLSIEQGLNRNLVYHAITSTIDSLNKISPEPDIFMTFAEVNKSILNILDQESRRNTEQNVFWNFYVPFFAEILKSDYYLTFCRYISVSYIPESLEWWNNNQTEAEKFKQWFEEGDVRQKKEP